MTIEPNTRIQHGDGELRINVVESLPSGHVRVQFFHEPAQEGEPTIKDSVWVDGPAEKVTEKRLLVAIDHKLTERRARDTQEAPRWQLPSHVQPGARTPARIRPSRPSRQPWGGVGGQAPTDRSEATDTKGS